MYISIEQGIRCLTGGVSRAVSHGNRVISEVRIAGRTWSGFE